MNEKMILFADFFFEKLAFLHENFKILISIHYTKYLILYLSPVSQYEYFFICQWIVAICTNNEWTYNAINGCPLGVFYNSNSFHRHFYPKWHATQARIECSFDVSETINCFGVTTQTDCHTNKGKIKIMSAILEFFFLLLLITTTMGLSN